MSWTKVIGPTQHVTFLGVDIDISDCTLSLGHEKLSKLHGILETFEAKRRAAKGQLQALAGSLNWACRVVRGGRFFSGEFWTQSNRYGGLGPRRC